MAVDFFSEVSSFFEGSYFGVPVFLLAIIVIVVVVLLLVFFVFLRRKNNVLPSSVSDSVSAGSSTSTQGISSSSVNDASISSSSSLSVESSSQSVSSVSPVQAPNPVSENEVASSSSISTGVFSTPSSGVTESVSSSEQKAVPSIKALLLEKFQPIIESQLGDKVVITDFSSQGDNFFAHATIAGVSVVLSIDSSGKILDYKKVKQFE